MKIIFFILLVCFFCSAEEKSGSYITDEYIPFLKEESKSRTAPFFGMEFGDKFLSPGPISSGSETITGAVWQPRFWLYGNYRSSVYSYDRGEHKAQHSEWANRLDVYGNLQLSGTERVLIGVQPLHRERDFYGHSFDPDDKDGENNPANLRIRTLFFEGDISELFPKLDKDDNSGLDIGFSIGRQHLNFQNGILINDTVDAVGLTKNTIRFEEINWLTNLRLAFIYAWGEVNRHDNMEDQNSKLFGFSANADTIWSTLELDLFYVDGDEDSGDLLVWGASNTQRLEKYNWTLRYLGSQTAGSDSIQSNSGHLFVNEVSWAPAKTDDVIYINNIVGIDNFTSAARDELSGGPLGMTGLSFAAKGLGSYPSPLNDSGHKTLASAIGWQMFFDNNSQYLLFELGHRLGTGSDGRHSTSIGSQWQISFLKRYIFQIDSFISHENNNYGWGLRTEFQIKF